MRGGLLQTLMATIALWTLMTHAVVWAGEEGFATATLAEYADALANFNCDVSVWPRSYGRNLMYLVLPLGWADYADYAEVYPVSGLKLFGPSGMPSFYSEAWVKARFASYDTQLRPSLFNTTTLDLAALIVLPPLISHRFQPSNPVAPLIPVVSAMFDWIAQHGVTDCA